jgi:hypothetical protein
MYSYPLKERKKLLMASLKEQHGVQAQREQRMAELNYILVSRDKSV